MALSRARSALIALLLAAATSPSRAEDADEPPAPPDNAYAAAERRAILVDADPGEATAFLDADQGERARQVADRRLYEALFRRATELAHLRELLFDGSSAVRIRSVLAADRGCVFCRQPEKLRDWASSRFALDEKTRSELDRALVEWGAMPASFQGWARARGYSPDSWKPVDWDRRSRLASEWARGAVDAIQAHPPSTRAEYNAAVADAVTASVWLGGTPLAAVFNTLRTAERALFAPAAAFDGNSRGAKEAASAAVGKPTSLLGRTQAFDAASRRMTADLMKPALLDEISDTQSGDVLRGFYRDHPLRLRLAPLSGEYARYVDDTGVITLNEDHVLEFLAERNRIPRDLALDGKLLHELAMEWAANFVHEATHQRQHAWAVENGVPFRFGLFSEQEAIQEEALYTLERRTRDRAYAAYLAAHRELSAVVREDARLADILEKSGAAELRRKAIDEYAGAPSLEQRAMLRLAFDGNRQSELEA